MTTPAKDALLAEELLIVRNSGEIPEIAFHGSLYFLTEDEEGPRIELTTKDIRQLEKEVIGRYRTIMLRDLEPANRDKRHYRGIKRCIFNWQRLEFFLARQGLDRATELRREIAEQLSAFLHNEALENRKGLRAASINCTPAELTAFCRLLGIEADQLPAAWQDLCQQADN